MPERSEYIERVRQALIDGQGWPPDAVPSEQYLGAAVDRSRAFVEAGGGWSVVAHAVEQIKRAAGGPE